jgi:hypothetical protein
MINMAWEFENKVSLILDHPSMNAKVMSRRMTSVLPDYCITAGDQKNLKSGAVRNAVVTVWRKRLHEEEWLDSDSQDFAETLRRCLETLRPHHNLFLEIRVEGHAHLQVVWFSKTIQSAGVVPADVLATCGSIGLDLGLEYYAPNESGTDSQSTRAK